MGYAIYVYIFVDTMEPKTFNLYILGTRGNKTKG